MRWFCLGLALLVGAPAPAQERPPSVVRDLVYKVESSRLTRTVGRLASFGTRHTLSEPYLETRGIGAARTWLEGEFQALTRLPGSRLQSYADTFPGTPGPLLPRTLDLANLGVTLPGTDPARVREALVVAAHYDSRASDPLDAEADAPGAVDNASGVAAVLEMATVMAAERPAVTIYFVATAGGEQGSQGSARLARQLKAGGVDVLGHGGRGPGGQHRPGRRRQGRQRRSGVLGGAAAPGERGRAPAAGPAGHRERQLRAGPGPLPQAHGRALPGGLPGAGDVAPGPGGRGRRAPALHPGGLSGRGGSPSWSDNYDRLQQNVRSSQSAGPTATPWPSSTPATAPGSPGCWWPSFRHLAFAPGGPQNVGCSGVGSPGHQAVVAPCPRIERITGIVLYHRRADMVAWQETKVFPKVRRTRWWRGWELDTDVFAVATLDAQGNESLPVAPRSITF